MKAYSPALDRALSLAAAAHRTQVRKGSQVPYIMHPVHVGILLLRHGLDEDVVIAGLLHDVVEDTSTTLAEVEASFGPEVARLVAAVTEDKRDAESGRERPWRVRKEEQLHHLDQADPGTAALKAADALHNCESLLCDLDTHGPAVWGRFKAPPDELLWYYGEVATRCRGRLGEHSLSHELTDAVARLGKQLSSSPAR